MLNQMIFRRTSNFGDLEQIRHGAAHTGIDYAMPEGTPLEAVTDGIITNIADFGHLNAGKTIVLKTEDGNSIIYGHLSEFKTHVGDHVHKGDVIGLSGNTGNSTGPHLHLGLKDQTGHFVNPEKYDSAVQAMGHHSNPLSDIGHEIATKYNEIADKVVGGEIQFILKPIGQFLADSCRALIDLLNFYSVEIITLSVIACGFGLMIDGLTGHRLKAGGKLGLVLLGGTIWRLILS